MNLITGMHRSGSSILSKLLLEAGLDFGDSSEFYPPDIWNPDGYFEKRRIIDLNMLLINGSLGNLSYAWLPSEATIIKRSHSMQSEMLDLIRSYSSLTIKENRFCLTLSAWLEHGMTIDRVLVCVRHPHDVVRSLCRRNRLPYFFGYRLWLEHYSRLLNTLRKFGIPFKVLEYESLISSQKGVSTLCDACAHFELEVSTENIEEILMKNIRSQPLRKIGKPIPLRVSEMYNVLLEQSI